MGFVLLALIVLAAIPSAVFVAGVALCAGSPLLMLYCCYYVTPNQLGVRRRFRLNLACWAGLACGIMLSDSGIAVRTINPTQGLLFGACAAVVVYACALALDCAAGPLLNWVREFWVPGHCLRCGYNLTGLSASRCPECGAALGDRNGDAAS